jgi:hypothetical protein
VKVLKNNALSIVMFTLFLLSFAGQAFAGWHEHNHEQIAHGEPEVSLGGYLRSGSFWEATAENWESEFLQMAAFLFLTAHLTQRGSEESKKPDDEPDDRADELVPKPDSPGPVHRGGLLLKLYSHSLSLTLALLFVVSFAIHLVGGLAKANAEALEHGEPEQTFFQFLGSSELWFQSFQNWQSEFLSVGLVIVLSIFLREKGSPESKPVHAPHSQTGE